MDKDLLRLRRFDDEVLRRFYIMYLEFEHLSDLELMKLKGNDDQAKVTELILLWSLYITLKYQI